MIYKLPKHYEYELDLLSRGIYEYGQGRINYQLFRPIHICWGIYNERPPDSFMLRIRVPGGLIKTEQLKTVATIASKYSDGNLHFTTRQDIQLHQLNISEICNLIKELHNISLSSWAGCGDTIRNIVVCNNCAKCTFNLYPYAIALTEFLLNQQTSYNLPRKLKIVLSGCKQDCAGACVADIGFIANIDKTDKRGFSVYVGGGLGAKSKIGHKIENFIDTKQIDTITEAIKRTFVKVGIGTKRNRARLRFLIETLSLEKFKVLYETEKDKITRDTNLGNLHTRIEELNIKLRTLSNPNNESITIPIFLGNIDYESLIYILNIAQKHNIEYITITNTQNIILKGIQNTLKNSIIDEIREKFPQIDYPEIYGNIITCVGADICTLGICQSQKLAADIWKQLLKNVRNTEKLSDIKINISGCPNSCGRTNISKIGLIGCMRKHNSISKPHYIIKLAGNTNTENPKLAKQVEIIPDSETPNYIANMLNDYINSDKYPDFDSFAQETLQKSFQETGKDDE